MTELRLVGVLALLAALVWGVGSVLKGQREAGAAQCRAEVAQATAEAMRLENARHQAATAAYLADRAAAARRLPEARHAISEALAAPDRCGDVALADVLVPAAALDGLRAAAGGGDGAASAAAR